MRAVGIICEYNPLHRGHAYHLERAREAGDVVVCVMSGNFTQRGEAAILPPVTRAQMAVAAGADLVVELPFPYAASSATYFATAGVRIVRALGCETLSFGCDDLDGQTLQDAVQHLTPVRHRFYDSMGSAAEYYAALDGKLLSNDILAVEYVRAIDRLSPRMQIYPVSRLGSRYTQTVLEGEFPSATALREALARGEDVCSYLPPAAREIFLDGIARYGVADTARLGSAILARLRVPAGNGNLADLGGGLLSHLEKSAVNATDYASLCEAAATKRYTNGRIRRSLLYLLAGVKQRDLSVTPKYVRLLAANAQGRAYLAETRASRKLPVVTKPRDVAALGANASRQRELAAAADALFALAAEKPVTQASLAVIPPFMAQ